VQKVSRLYKLFMINYSISLENSSKYLHYQMLDIHSIFIHAGFTDIKYYHFLQCSDCISGQQNRLVCWSYDHDRSRKAFSKLLERSISRNKCKTKWGISATFPFLKYTAKLSLNAKFLQSVADIFHTLLKEIERANGNVQEKPNCIICWIA